VLDCVFYTLLICETQRYVFINNILKVIEESSCFNLEASSECQEKGWHKESQMGLQRDMMEGNTESKMDGQSKTECD
jgi:hypothetical protein